MYVHAHASAQGSVDGVTWHMIDECKGTKIRVNMQSMIRVVSDSLLIEVSLFLGSVKLRLT